MRPYTARVLRHRERQDTIRQELKDALWELRRVRRELDMATGVLNQVDAYEHVHAYDAWRAQRERLRHGIDIAALFPEEDSALAPANSALWAAWRAEVAAWDALSDEATALIDDNQHTQEGD